ncbi:hypothetical protein O7599_08080 [Streptomyces sp. WMMC500]|uniref:SDR family oxidoreductase n=1 Tax=Streptomyces sp. WMMC500 TaxID=3015154 RepID=UPI00248BBC02|nr:NAD-dependent epimerase/dehydratase family protein [Streptomyces sp. WMMC500]WBB62478.1 hypothetical protein O7599_08080 [Streptomyces sp. WMMC500]
MRVVVAGATGLIGARTESRLRERGVEVRPLSRGHGVNVRTGRGLDAALRGADVVVDVTDAPVRSMVAGVRFFRVATAHLLAAAAAAGVEHHVVLSMVGAGPLHAGYFGVKESQEDQARRSVIPHSIVRATLSFESIEAMVLADPRMDGPHRDEVRVPPVPTRPVAADDIAAAVAHVAVGPPLFGIREVAGPEEYRLDEFVAKLLAARGDTRDVVADEKAALLGARLKESSLLPEAAAHVGRTTFGEWLARI